MYPKKIFLSTLERRKLVFLTPPAFLQSLKQSCLSLCFAVNTKLNAFFGNKKTKFKNQEPFFCEEKTKTGNEACKMIVEVVS